MPESGPLSTPDGRSLLSARQLGTPGRWCVERDSEGVPRIVAYGLGRFRDEIRTVAILKDASILSNEDAELIVAAVKAMREYV